MRDLTRRQLLQHLALTTAGLGVACTPLKVLTSAYPQAFDDDAELTDRVLRAFALTVIPSAPAGDPDLARAFTDPDLPFAPYAGFFASDLARRAGKRVDTPVERPRGAPRAPPVPPGAPAGGATPKTFRRGPPLGPGAVFARRLKWERTPPETPHGDNLFV